MVRTDENNVTVDTIKGFAHEIIEIVVEYETRELIDIDTAMRIVREVREIVSQVESGTLHPSKAMRMLDHKMELVKGLAKTHRVTPPPFSASTRVERAEEVVVRESHRGLYRSEYHFVIDGDRLVHISRYSLSQKKDYDRAEYTVNLNKLRGKKIVEISSSRSGIFCWATTYPAEDLALEYTQRRREQVSLSFLNGFEFTHLTQREKMFLQTEWRQYYLPMIEELRKFSITALKNLNRGFPYIGLPSLISCQIESQASYPLSFLIPYSEDARRRSLEGLTKEIHQLWIAIRILRELGRTGRLRDLYLNFKQSSYYAIASFHCRDGLCSLWYEFDMNPHTMCRGMLWYSEASNALKQFYQRVMNILRRKRLDKAPLRPDIAILLGGASCNALVKGFKVKMIIECKNQSYEHWARDIDTQIIPYKEIFQPNTMVLASLKKIPKNTKEYLSRYGIIVIDEVYPGGKGIDELLHLVDSALM